MAAISAFRVTQHSQIFSLFFRNRIQCIALYQLYNSQALLNLRRGYYSHLFNGNVRFGKMTNNPCFAAFSLLKTLQIFMLKYISDVRISAKGSYDLFP